jgi:hypothetical protein
MPDEIKESSGSGQNGKPETGTSHFYQLSWVRYASLLMIVMILVGFWVYSESLIGSIESLRSELNHQREVLKVLDAPGIAVFALSGSSAEQHAMVFFDRSSEIVAFYCASLPPPRQRHLLSPMVRSG